MNTTNVFSQNIKAYNRGERIILNKGGTRSSKTYSILQLIYLIAFKSTKPLIISVCSYALPHLKIGAMRSFEEIITEAGANPYAIKNISESYYKVGNSIVEFFGVDNLGKVHGPERDILFVNECNYIKTYDIVRHLMVRTKKTVFMDYNPTREFWVDNEMMERNPTIIHSTYLDNAHLTHEQIKEIESNKSNKHWWRVYGQGLTGQLEDAILSNWEFGEFDDTLPYIYGLDFGSKHPDAMLKVAINRAAKKVYWKEEIYQNGLSTNELIKIIKSRNVGTKLIVADSSAKRTIQDIKLAGLNIRATIKNQIVEDIKALWAFTIIVDPGSFNLQKNLNNWVWLDKKGEVPIDVDDDCIDAGRYGFAFLNVPQKKGARFNIPKYA